LKTLWTSHRFGEGTANLTVEVLQSHSLNGATSICRETCSLQLPTRKNESVWIKTNPFSPNINPPHVSRQNMPKWVDPLLLNQVFSVFNLRGRDGLNLPRSPNSSVCKLLPPKYLPLFASQWASWCSLYTTAWLNSQGAALKIHVRNWNKWFPREISRSSHVISIFHPHLPNAQIRPDFGRPISPIVRNSSGPGIPQNMDMHQVMHQVMVCPQVKRWFTTSKHRSSKICGTDVAQLLQGQPQHRKLLRAATHTETTTGTWSEHGNCRATRDFHGE
jgi:hypothetical protein